MVENDLERALIVTPLCESFAYSAADFEEQKPVMKRYTTFTHTPLISPFPRLVLRHPFSLLTEYQLPLHISREAAAEGPCGKRSSLGRGTVELLCASTGP